MAIENGAYRVCYRSHVVAFDEDHISACDDPCGRVSCALQKLGKHGKDRRGVSPCRRGLADGESDLAQRHGIACDGIHQKHDVSAEVAEVFRYCSCSVGTFGAQQGCLVGGNHDDNRLCQAFRAQVLFR